MDKKQMKIFGIVALVVCAVCVFVAIERYQANANNVNAMNQLQRSSPMGGTFGFGEMRPTTPAATKYAVLFAVIFGIAGIVLLAKSAPSLDQTKPPEQQPGANG
jgi:predicted membrane protein